MFPIYLLLLVMVMVVVMSKLFVPRYQILQPLYLTAAQGCTCVLLPPAAMHVLTGLSLGSQLFVVWVANLQGQVQSYIMYCCIASPVLYCISHVETPPLSFTGCI
jgi:hypothetical protein